MISRLKLKRDDSMYSVKQISLWLLNCWKGYHKMSIINTATGLVSVVLSLAFVWASKRVIDTATGDYKGSLLTAGLWLGSLIVAEIILFIIQRWVRNSLGVRTQNSIQQYFFRHLLHSEWHSKKTYHSGDILNRLERDVTDVVDILTQTIPATIVVFFQLGTAFWFLCLMDSSLAWVTVGILPVFIIMSRFYMLKMRSINKNVRESDSAIQSILQESVQNRMVLKTLEQCDNTIIKLDKRQGILRSQIMDRTRFSIFANTTLSIGFSGGYFIAFMWGAYRLSEGEITFGVMTAFMQLVARIQGPVLNITQLIPTFISVLTACERLMELEEQPLEADGEPEKLDDKGGVKIDNLTFQYNPEENSKKVLENFSYTFPPGSSTAILGETGSGKTTLIRLMLALLHPTNGRITVYNDHQEFEVNALTRCNFVYVPQGNSLFSGTIRENMLMGRPDATEDDIRTALEYACADFVYKLKDGLDTRCSEKGGGLSEGQAQRIAIARALLRRGSILLLDEATSALDLETEKNLLQRLTQGEHGKTLIFVTHRLAVMEYCNQTLKIENRKE